MARRSNLQPGVFVLALVIAMLLWGMAHSSSDEERGFDVPIVFQDIPEDLVLTDQSTDVVNIRVLGSRASLRNVSPTQLEYRIDVSGSKRGPAAFEVESVRLEEQLPSGARIVSRSPASVEATFERRGRKSVRIRADVEGRPAEGYRVTAVETEPPRVWLAGARSEVLRLQEVVTETVDVTGITESQEREVRLSLGPDKVWMEEPKPVKVRIRVEAAPTTGSPG